MLMFGLWFYLVHVSGWCDMTHFIANDDVFLRSWPRKGDGKRRTTILVTDHMHGVVRKCALQKIFACTLYHHTCTVVLLMSQIPTRQRYFQSHQSIKYHSCTAARSRKYVNNCH